MLPVIVFALALYFTGAYINKSLSMIINMHTEWTDSLKSIAKRQFEYMIVAIIMWAWLYWLSH
jgi:hypothetical protein